VRQRKGIAPIEVMTEGNDQISPADGVDVSGGSKEQQAAGVGILLQIMMLVLSFVLGHVLRRKKIYVLPEASASLLIGLLVGTLANISHTQTSIRSQFTFYSHSYCLISLSVSLEPHFLTFCRTGRGSTFTRSFSSSSFYLL